jgi:hypothetical protein
VAHRIVIQSGMDSQTDFAVGEFIPTKCHVFSVKPDRPMSGFVLLRPSRLRRFPRAFLALFGCELLSPLLAASSTELKPAVVEKRIPVEADAVDEDGIHVHFLLHVVKGFAKELEVYKDDGSPIRRMPSPGDLEMCQILFRESFPELSRALIPRAHALYSQMGEIAM